MTPEKIELLKDFVNFTCAKLHIQDPVTVVIRNGRDQYITTTASYLSQLLQQDSVSSSSTGNYPFIYTSVRMIFRHIGTIKSKCK